jgi:hypothetical protein
MSQATQLRHSAEGLYARYRDGMPGFLMSYERGAHFKNLWGFVQHASMHVSEGTDRLAIMLRLFNFAISKEDNVFELAWCVHEIGKGLYRIMSALKQDDMWQFEEASAWACALNKEGTGKYSVYVPIVKSNFNGIEMTGGAPQSLISQVFCWGVKTRRGDVERKAIVK